MKRAPLLVPYLTAEWGPYTTDVLRSVRTAGNRLASAPAIISLDQSAGSLATEAALLLRDVMANMTDLSRQCFAPDVSFPLPSLLVPNPTLTLSSLLVCPSRTPVRVQATFLLAFSRREIGYPSDACTATRPPSVALSNAYVRPRVLIRSLHMTRSCVMHYISINVNARISQIRMPHAMGSLKI